MARTGARRGLAAIAVLALLALVWRSWTAPSDPGDDARPGAPIAAEPALPPVTSAPPAQAPAPRAGVAAPAAEGAAYFDEAGEPTRALARDALERALREDLPRHKLSLDEVDRAADALLALRRAQRALRALPTSPEHRDERAALLAEVKRAVAAFTEIVELSPAEFTARVSDPGIAGGGGIDTFTPGEPIPEPVYLDDVR